MRGWADFPRASTATAGSPPVQIASTAVRAALTRGLRSFSIGLIGDSTGDGLTQVGDVTIEWFQLLGSRLAAKYPGWTVVHRRWNPGATQEIYDPPTLIQQGTLNGGGDRYALLASGTLQYAASSANNGDMELIVRVMPTAGWAPGGAAALRTIASRYSASASNRGWYFALNESGNLVFVWSTAGTADTGTVTSTTAVPFTNGTPGWVRMTFDVDNGAAGNDVKFYTAADSQFTPTSWTQLGSTVTTAGTTSVATTYTTYYLGSINTTPTNFFNGRIYWAEIRQNLPGAGTQTVLTPVMPDWWDQATTSGPTVKWFGSPVLMMLNGSASGQNISYFNDSTRRLRLNTVHGQMLLFCSDSHNEGASTMYGWRTSVSAWLTDLRNRVFCPIVWLTQTPSLPGTQRADQETCDFASVRGMFGLATAATFNGVYPLDVWPQFTDLENQLIADHLHPSLAGSTVWSDYVYSQLFA